MKIIVRALCALIVVVLLNLTSAQVFWAESVGGTCSASLCVEKTPETFTVRANLGAGQSVVELLLNIPQHYGVTGGDGVYGYPIMGMGNFASPLDGVRFPTKVVFWGTEPFDGTDSVTFGAGGGSVIPLGFYSDLILPPTGPDPSPWLMMALVRDVVTDQQGWVGATMVPIPEPRWGSVAVFITFGLLVLVVFVLRRHHT